MKRHIHIFGASGSGTTTISEIISNKLGYVHFDSDNYFWLPTSKPFSVERNRDECLNMMNDDLSEHDKWILSGSIANWGNDLIPHFDLVVFVYVPPKVRLERLKKRELERYGKSILFGGNRYEESRAFIEWAASYDKEDFSGRSLLMHKEWLKNIDCDVIKIENDVLEDSVKSVLLAIKQRD